MKASKLRENLIEHRAMAELSRVLVDLKRDCPLPDTLDSLKLDAIPPAPLKLFLDEHGFRSLSAKLDNGVAPWWAAHAAARRRRPGGGGAYRPDDAGAARHAGDRPRGL